MFFRSIILFRQLSSFIDGTTNEFLNSSYVASLSTVSVTLGYYE